MRASSQSAMMQYSMNRAPSDLSFSIGKLSINEEKLTSKKQREYARKQQQYRHSKLSSALGRESRTLKKIYKWVDSFT